ncbi:hypothetical protein [Demequina flava]|uniref:hypothetical protein n=1 Tax=Demequina flava TaxID=1095025 RepID=UPI000AA3A8A8|nr:hypothetical protein [Demequina flava]
MSDTSVWTVSATREPSDDFLARLDRRWRDGIEAAADGACTWSRDPMHTFVLTHVDRAAHRRRLRAVFFTAGTAHERGHGFTPMSDLVTGDMFGPQEIEARHTGDSSPLAAALELAMSDPHVLAVPLMTERMYTQIDSLDAHAVDALRPGVHGAVLPIMYAPADETLDDVDARENMLRAGGFATYTVVVDFAEDEPVDIHRSVAVVLEDALDSVAHLKMDSNDGALASGLAWPLVALRADASWDPDRCRAASGASREEPAATRTGSGASRTSRET